MPQDFDNSSGGQLWVDDDRWGPLVRPPTSHKLWKRLDVLPDDSGRRGT